MAKQRVKHFEAGGAAYGDVTLDDGTTVNTDDIGPGDPGWGGDIGTDTDPGISAPGDAEFPSVVDPLTLTPAQQSAQDAGVRQWLIDNGMSASDAATATGTAGFIDKLLSKYSDGKGGVNWANVAKTLIPAAGGIMALNSNNATNASADRGYQKGIPSLTLSRTKNAIPTDRRPGAGGVSYFSPATFLGQRNMDASPEGGTAGSGTTTPVGGPGGTAGTGTGTGGGIAALPTGRSSSSYSYGSGGGGGVDTPIDAGWTTDFAAKNAAGWDAKTGGSNGMEGGTLKTRGGQQVTHQQLMDFVATNPSPNQVFAQAQKWGMSMGDVNTALNNVGLLFNNGKVTDSQMNDAGAGSIYNRLRVALSYGQAPYSTADEGISYSDPQRAGQGYGTDGKDIWSPTQKRWIAPAEVKQFLATNPNTQQVLAEAQRLGLTGQDLNTALKGQGYTDTALGQHYNTLDFNLYTGGLGYTLDANGNIVKGGAGNLRDGKQYVIDGANNWTEKSGYIGAGSPGSSGTPIQGASSYTGIYSGKGAPASPAAPTTPSNADILAWYQQHQGDADFQQQAQQAMQQYGLNAQQVAAAGVPTNALQPAAAAAPTDWNSYMQKNPDLGAAGINTVGAAQQHWSQYGKNENRQFAAGGGIRGLPGAAPAQGRFLRGPGDGVSDAIPARIDGKREARLADGEFVVPARIVSELGNGSSEAGSRKLYAMLDRIEKTRHRNKSTAKNTRADKHLPA